MEDFLTFVMNHEKRSYSKKTTIKNTFYNIKEANGVRKIYFLFINTFIDIYIFHRNIYNMIRYSLFINYPRGKILISEL